MIIVLAILIPIMQMNTYEKNNDEKALYNRINGCFSYLGYFSYSCCSKCSQYFKEEILKKLELIWQILINSRVI